MSRAIRRIVFIGFVIAIPATIYLSPTIAAGIYNVVAFFAPVWLPAALFAALWPLWLRFVRSRFIFSVPYEIIELKPGDSTENTTRAMELVLYSLYHRVDITPQEALFQGKIRLPWAFELYAHAGGVRFFVHLPRAHRGIVEASLRAEYRDIDIDEARDYSREINFSPFSMRLQMREFTLAKPDPYPLKTYTAHVGEKRDAFNEFLGQLASASEHEHIFVSWIMRPHQRERETFWGGRKIDTLHEDAHREIATLVGEKGDMRSVPDATRTLILAIEEGLKKPSFDTGVRVLYMADRKHFDTARAEELDNLLSPFYDERLNSFSAYDPRERTGWFLSEVLLVAPIVAMDYFLQLYRRRAFFVPPYYGRPFVLNTEELATVFHIPKITRASALAKMKGLKLEPPENLPV